MQTSARTTADDFVLLVKVEAGVCDIQYIFCDNMVSVVVMMCDLTLSNRLKAYHQITHVTHVSLLKLNIPGMLNCIRQNASVCFLYLYNLI